MFYWLKEAEAVQGVPVQRFRHVNPVRPITRQRL